MLKWFPALPAGSDQSGLRVWRIYCHVVFLLLSLTPLLGTSCITSLDQLQNVSLGDKSVNTHQGCYSYVSDPIKCQCDCPGFIFWSCSETRVCTTWRSYINYLQWGIFLLTGVCMGWNRIVITVPVKPHKWAAATAAALWDGHLREEEKEAEDGPRRPQPSRWEQSYPAVTEVISVWPSPPDFGFLCLISQVFLWTHHLRDWTWERLRLWRIFKGLQSKSTDWFEQQLRYLNPRCGPLTSPATLNDLARDTVKFDFLGFQTHL